MIPSPAELSAPKTSLRRIIIVAIVAVLVLPMLGVVVFGVTQLWSSRISSGFDRERLQHLASAVSSYRSHSFRELDADKQDWPTAEDGAPVVLNGLIILDSIRGDASVDPLHFKLPKALRADAPDDVRYVAVLEWGTRQVGEYTGGGKAYQHYCDLYVYDHHAQALVVNRRIVGGQPPSTIRTQRGSSRNGYGSKPTQAVLGLLTHGA